jgi:hypothetical protein
MDQKNSRCLVLNSDYTPLTVINWKRALVWSIRYQDNPNMGIEIIDFYKNDHILGPNGKKFPVPAVAKTVKYLKLSNKRVNFCRQNLFIRDNYTCQYCGVVKNIDELTYDHVIPKSIWSYENGSPTNWTNIVTACVRCNRKKSNKTPKQAKMPLIKLPQEPMKNIKYLPVTMFISRIRQDIPDEWAIYLPKSYFS